MQAIDTVILSKNYVPLVRMPCASFVFAFFVDLETYESSRFVDMMRVQDTAHSSVKTDSHHKYNHHLALLLHPPPHSQNVRCDYRVVSVFFCGRECV